ncbi:MAG: hypothetical protein EP332_15245 [Bacteroidetes bacterium]|nr:MAG: hypothetical protein EP332_15245 [Bacteroidota bacterium]
MITVYSEQKSPRLSYILEVICQGILGTGFKVMSDWKKFEKLDLPKINYSQQYSKGTLSIVPQDLLFEKNIKNQKIKMKEWDELPCFFQTNKGGEVPFDLFAAAFYLITRYEEYLEDELDQHGRYPVKSSLAYKEGFLDLPLVNLWVQKLKGLLVKKHPSYVFPEGEFHYISTIDVDMAFCYKHKGAWRNIGGIVRELLGMQFASAAKRMKVLSNQEPDPYDNFAWQIEQHQQQHIEVMYFMLLADHGKFDKNIDPDNEAFIEIIQNLAQYHRIGIHPSYNSNKQKKKLKTEVHRLENILLKEVETSRQHFLMFNIRETYQRLYKQGIKEDHSMGYSEMPGFRASICTPFRFFDLAKNETLDITLYPFAVMDVAFRHFLDWDIQKTEDYVVKLMRQVAEVQGYFISVFHNESLSDFDKWKGWRKVYLAMLDEANLLSNQAASAS